MHRVLISVSFLFMLDLGCVDVDPSILAPRQTVVYRHPKRPVIIHRVPPPSPNRTEPRFEPKRIVAKPTTHTDWFPKSGRISRRWTTIVIHHSATRAGNAKLFDKFHRSKGWDELGYHFVIGNGTNTPDGFVEVGPRWHKQKHGAHCKTPDNYFNEHGIGICLVGDFTRSSPTPRQLASLEELLHFLTSQCGIPASRITTHAAVTGKTQCPGRHFHLAGIRDAMSRPVTASAIP